ncbi:MAG: nicotinate (nicotinamide) nucleotide adenylyltransferase [Ruminococcaceae bacterium]|nr:nicotinate (nicotinamide) nucleotide adenylyltransferase [Oscillospiraceae bacterium]
MKKIAIYGGSFDPPHKGHKLLAENLARVCGAEKVIIIPTALSPFKNSSSATAEDRLNMCKLFFKESLFSISDIEIKRGGKSYTVDTLMQMKAEYPNAELFLFMGDDMLLSFDKWYKHEEILKLATIVCACRTENLEELDNMKEFVKNVLKAEDRVIICESVPFEISSTEIRSSLKTGGNIGLSEDVYGYISSRGLYQ